MNKRSEIKKLLLEKEKVSDRLEELAYLLYEEEIGDTLEGVPVRIQGYKKVLRRLGFVI